MDRATKALLADLVDAYHILEAEGQGSGISGHLTARHPKQRTFWTIPFGLGFGDAEAKNLVEADFDLKTVTGTAAVNPTLHTHTAIYGSRPDVNCILHTHADNSLALGITGSTIEPVTQSGALFYDDIAFFDEFDGIVLERAEAVSIAGKLGRNRGILLKNHGAIVVGATVREATIAAIVLETAARVQLKAMGAGKLSHLPREAALQAKQFLLSEEITRLRWQQLVRSVRLARPAILDTRAPARKSIRRAAAGRPQPRKR